MAIASILVNPTDQTERLVEHLRETRETVLDRMIRRGVAEPAHLTLIASIDTVLKTLGGTSPARADRAVVGAAGGMIKLTLYAKKDAVATVVLDPVRAIELAGRLVQLLAPWLARGPREAPRG